MIIIIDYGMGNLGSIYNMFKKIKIESEITTDLGKIEKADKLLLPGVGSFDKAMFRIKETGIKEILDKKVLIEKIPLLGICLGMQILTNSSEEGELAGLGYIPAKTIKFIFPNDKSIKVPHMGWNSVKPVKESPFTFNLTAEPRFYFVHSYYVKLEDQTYSLLKANYGEVEFDAAITKGNIFGAQFHPEKSHKFGMRLLENFARL